MTEPLTYADLERRFDGPIPQPAPDAIRHGSATNAAIVRTKDSLAFFRGLIMRAGPSARTWRALGYEKMVEQNIGDGWFYLREWRVLRRRLNDLRGTDAAVANAAQVFDQINQVTDGEAPE